MTLHIPDYTIVGDGKFLAVVFGGQAYVFENYFLQSTALSVTGPDNHCSFDFSVVAQSFQTCNAADICIKFPANMTIFELLQEINKKLEER